MPPPFFLFPPFPSLHLHPHSQPAPPRLHLLPPSPACLPGLLRLLRKSPKDPRGRIPRRRAGVRPLLTCSARSEARPPPSGPATAGASSRRPARGLGSGARRGLARSRSGTDARAKSSAVVPRGRGRRDPVRGLSLMGGDTAGAHGGPGWERWKPRLPGELWGGAAAGEELPVEGGGAYMAERQVPDRPVLRHLLPHQRHLQVPVGAGLGVQRPVMLTLHLGRDWWVRLQEAAENLPRSTPAGGSRFQHRGRGPGPGTKWRATPARKTAPSSGLPEQLHPIGGPVGGLGQAEGVGSCWEPPRLGQGPPRDRCLGQDHRLQPGGRPPPGGPGAPLTRPDSTQLVSMTRVWLCCSQTRRQKSPTVCGRGPWAAMNSPELQRPWREAGGSGPPCPRPLPSEAPEPRLTPALRG